MFDRCQNSVTVHDTARAIAEHYDYCCTLSFGTQPIQSEYVEFVCNKHRPRLMSVCDIFTGLGPTLFSVVHTESHKWGIQINKKILLAPLAALCPHSRSGAALG